MVMKIGGEDLSKKWVESVFTKVDSSADGKISKDEFEEAFSKILEKKISGENSDTSKFDISKLFAKIDTDQDGNITKDELSKFVEESKKMPPPPPPAASGLDLLELLLSKDANAIFSEIDTDGDGVISQAEFVKYIEKQKEAIFSGTDTSTSDKTGSTASTGVI